MIFKKLNFKIHSPSTGAGLIILALTQFPFAINESLKLACFATTWADYAVFWSWKEIPLDSRLRHCNGANIPSEFANENHLKSKPPNSL